MNTPRFDEYCRHRCSVFAAEHSAARVGVQPEGTSTLGILANVPADNAQAVLRAAALAASGSVACVRIAAPVAYDGQHSEACAGVLPLRRVDGLEISLHVSFVGVSVLWAIRPTRTYYNHSTPRLPGYCTYDTNPRAISTQLDLRNL